MVAIINFLNPIDDEGSKSNIVVMEHVLWQNDHNFLSLLDHVRDGTINDEDVKFLTKQLVENLPLPRREGLFRRFEADII
jgi:hypothetical protein